MKFIKTAIDKFLQVSQSTKNLSYKTLLACHSDPIDLQMFLTVNELA